MRNVCLHQCEFVIHTEINTAFQYELQIHTGGVMVIFMKFILLFQYELHIHTGGDMGVFFITFIKIPHCLFLPRV